MTASTLAPTGNIVTLPTSIRDPTGTRSSRQVPFGVPEGSLFFAICEGMPRRERTMHMMSVTWTTRWVGSGSSRAYQLVAGRPSWLARGLILLAMLIIFALLAVIVVP